jgi:hypothetical protein
VEEHLEKDILGEVSEKTPVSSILSNQYCILHDPAASLFTCDGSVLGSLVRMIGALLECVKESPETCR